MCLLYRHVSVSSNIHYGCGGVGTSQVHVQEGDKADYGLFEAKV